MYKKFITLHFNMDMHIDNTFMREEIDCKEKVERNRKEKEDVPGVERRRKPVI